jgi:hypothetical protein
MTRKTFVGLIACVALGMMFVRGAVAQEAPYFVTYDHHLEEPGSLEIEAFSTAGVTRAPQPGYIAPWLEFEYGVKAWWTSELYLEGQSTWGDSTIFTGWRLENRFRPLAREHRINPVLYLEYENVNEASRIQKEIVGHAGDSPESNAELRQTHAHELEGKLILSGTAHDWNITGNFMLERNLSEDEGTEFGYALAISRPLARIASGRECRFCRENFTAGLELYGGLGSTERFGFAETAHYLAPVIAWRLSDNMTLHFSPGFGLTHVSEPALIRFGYSYEIRGFRDMVSSLFGSKK